MMVYFQALFLKIVIPGRMFIVMAKEVDIFLKNNIRIR